MIIRLDQDWLAQAWEGEAPQQASLVLLGAHPADEEAFAPCAPPPRIALRYLDRDGAARQRLLSCVNYCGPSLSDGLWGRLTRLVGVDAQTLPDRRIELVLRFRKLGFDPETGSNQNAQGETVYGSEIRTRPRSFYGPFGPAEGSTAGSCTELY